MESYSINNFYYIMLPGFAKRLSLEVQNMWGANFQ